ncbi:MAG: hypothetical protein HYY18_22870 [Planctomycetes bacterium]|nr:hypothetical protein [Planctomycetota bacterium]
MRRAALVLLLAGFAGAEEPLQLKDRWVYVSRNLWVDANIPQVEDIFRRAAKAGYTGILLADSKFSRLEDMDKRYFANVDRLRKLAAELRLEIVPAVFPIGYSEGLLSRDPNLAEALPVREALFVVKGGEARVEADPAVAFRGGDFADLSKWDWKDDCVTADGGAARMTDPKGGNARIVQKVKVSPYRQYHLSVRVKTEAFRGEPRVAVLAGKRSLNHTDLGVKPTQDWAEHHVVFNSLEEGEVGIYLGAWGASTGSLWWDDARLEECGPVNLVRRDGAPLAVKREGGAVLVEGKGFEKLADLRMGTVPWPGGYEVWHEPPALKTGLADGTRLRVSYHHAITVHSGQVMICPSEPKTLELLRDQAKRVHAAWGAKSYFMSHDEIRVLNQDDACRRRDLDAGAILADNVSQCVKILREVNPGGRIFVWSDMFDPNHNAHDDYYLVRGDLAKSWEGLDKDVIVACWHFEKRTESLRFFADRGHRTLIAGYYDAEPEKIRDWLEAAGKTKGVEGIMYTTWENRYGDLEKFAELLPAR